MDNKELEVEEGTKKPNKQKPSKDNKSSFVTFRMDDENLKLLEKIAASQMRSRSAQCFYVINEHIKEHYKNEGNT